MPASAGITTVSTISASATATASEHLVPDVAAALARLAGEQAVALPLLGDAERAPLLAAARALSYRRATAVTGTEQARVYQDFFLTTALAPDDLFHRYAARLTALLKAGAALLDPSPLGPGFELNDLILQRYEAGSAGITPHRDHLRYRELVALVALSGGARFLITADRAGSEPRGLAIAPGSLLLMLAPGFAGCRERPFHALDRIESERYSLGLRYVAEAS